MEPSGEEAILRSLQGAWPGLQVRAADAVDSTNLRLKEAARAGRIKPPYLLTARTQTAGRGRLGRAFVSPRSGLYMSLLITPPENAGSGTVTVTAAVAVCRAVEETTGLRPKIKWVNDLFLRGKKICGILAEGLGRDAVVGIGVNVLPPPGGFPPEAGVAGALNADVDLGVLAGRVAAHFYEGLWRRSPAEVMEDYRARMPLIGREICFERNGEIKNARVTGVDDQGGLMIESAEGADVLRCGEISLGSQGFSRDPAFE